MRGYFITFEGGEGSGKSTQLRLADEYLRSQGYETVLTKEPRGKIREILLSPESQLTPLAEVFLYYADRTQHLTEVVMPALQLGKIVLSDRHNDSTLAYQQYGRQLDPGLFAVLTSKLPVMPDLTLLLDIPVDQGLQRTTTIEFGEKDRFEREALEFHERVRQGYLALAVQHPKRITIVDATQPKETVSASIQKILDALLRG